MRFMLIVKANKDMEAGEMPGQQMLEAMARYHEDLARAGALLDASGLQPSSNGARIRFSRGTRTVIDGPFTEAKELVAGYTLIQAGSREEAIEWAKRMPFEVDPAGRDAEVEVRQMFELEDFTPGQAVERFRELGISGARTEV